VTRARVTLEGESRQPVAVVDGQPADVYPESEYEAFRLAGPPTYATERGLEPNTCRIWQIGDDPVRGRMTVPIRDAQGRLVGIKGRTYRNDRDKYVPYLVFNQGDWLFGHHLLAHDQQDRPVVVVEGEIDTMKVWQVGYDVVGLMGSKPTTTQRRSLEFLDRPLVLFPDGDKAGIDCMTRLARYLSDFTTVRWVEPVAERDPGALSRPQITDAIDSAKLWV
jgi:DNA primase